MYPLTYKVYIPGHKCMFIDNHKAESRISCFKAACPKLPTVQSDCILSLLTLCTISDLNLMV